MKHKLYNYDSRKIRKTIGPIGGRTIFPSERQNNKETQELVKKLGGKVAAECRRNDFEMTRKPNMITYLPLMMGVDGKIQQKKNIRIQWLPWLQMIW